TAFLGLTLRCARCHDHKFEPFTQEDYYRMLAVFEPLKRPQVGRKELTRHVGTEAELTTYEANKNAATEPPKAYIFFEPGPKAPATRIFKRGDPHKPLREVTPGL